MIPNIKFQRNNTSKKNEKNKKHKLPKKNPSTYSFPTANKMNR